MYSATLNDRAMRYMVARNGWSMSAALNGHYACCRLFNNMSGYHQMPLALCATGRIFSIEEAELLQRCSAACSVPCVLAILRRHDVPLCVLYLLCCFTCLLPGCLLQSGRWALDTHARTYYMSPAFHGGFASPAARAAAFSLCPKGAKKRCKNLHSILRACSVRVAQPKRLAGLRCCRAAQPSFRLAR